jgi:hypothetical protein
MRLRGAWCADGAMSGIQRVMGECEFQWIRTRRPPESGSPHVSFGECGLSSHDASAFVE